MSHRNERSSQASSQSRARSCSFTEFKLPIGDATKRFMLLLLHTKDTFTMVLTDGESVWRSRENDQKFDRVKKPSMDDMSLKDYAKKLCEGLSSQDEEQKSFKYELAKDESQEKNLVFDIHFQLGIWVHACRVHLHKGGKRWMNYMLKHVHTETQRLMRERRSAESQVKQIKRQKVDALKLVSEFKDIKERAEESLMKKFVLVLNEKKRAIRKLRARIVELERGDSHAGSSHEASAPSGSGEVQSESSSSSSAVRQKRQEIKQQEDGDDGMDEIMRSILSAASRPAPLAPGSGSGSDKGAEGNPETTEGQDEEPRDEELQGSSSSSNRKTQAESSFRFPSELPGSSFVVSSSSRRITGEDTQTSLGNEDKIQKSNDQDVEMEKVDEHKHDFLSSKTSTGLPETSAGLLETTTTEGTGDDGTVGSLENSEAISLTFSVPERTQTQSQKHKKTSQSQSTRQTHGGKKLEHTVRRRRRPKRSRSPETAVSSKSKQDQERGDEETGVAEGQMPSRLRPSQHSSTQRHSSQKRGRKTTESTEPSKKHKSQKPRNSAHVLKGPKPLPKKPMVEESLDDADNIFDEV